MVMASSFGLQFAFELTKVFPIKDAVQYTGNRILEFARALRKTNSDIVVEEDLAQLVGQLRIDPSFEQGFREAVRKQNVASLPNVDEVYLSQGAGPTVQNGLKDRRYMSAIIQLSMMCSVHSCPDVANMLTNTMDIRNNRCVPGANSSPGYVGILGTLEAVTSQTVDFDWSAISKQVEEKLASHLKSYHYTPAYYRITPAVMLAAFDAFAAVQRLPADRKIIVTNEIGIITLIVWAHFLLGLHVVVEGDFEQAIHFVTQDLPQVSIIWANCEYKGEEFKIIRSWERARESGPEFRLLDADASVILSSKASEESKLIQAQERVPLRGSGTLFLRRKLNNTILTPESDPIYKSIVNYVTALAIFDIGKFYRRDSPVDDADADEIASLYSTKLENWRFMCASKMLFFGLEPDVESVKSFGDFVEETSISGKNSPDRFKSSKLLPVSFSGFFKRVVDDDNAEEFVKYFKRMLEELAESIGVFAFVANVENCGDLPVRMQAEHTPTFRRSKYEVYAEMLSPKDDRRACLDCSHIFLGLASRIIDDPFDIQRAAGEDRAYGSHRSCWLFSARGWSVYLPTVGGADPAEVRPELVYIEKGVPTFMPGGERRNFLLDGVLQGRVQYEPTQGVICGINYYPNTTSKTVRSRQFWSKLSTNFEMTIFVDVQSLPYRGAEELKGKRGHEFRKMEVSRLKMITQEILRYSKMQEMLWGAVYTPPGICPHQPCIDGDTSVPAPLGPEAVAITGPNATKLNENPPERVVIVLTGGDPGLRWIALRSFYAGDSTAGGMKNQRFRMVCRPDCCPTCALEYVLGFHKHWILIL